MRVVRAAADRAPLLARLTRPARLPRPQPRSAALARRRGAAAARRITAVEQSREQLAALEAADTEDDLLERLGTLAIPDAWRLAEPLAIASVNEEWLRELETTLAVLAHKLERSRIGIERDRDRTLPRLTVQIRAQPGVDEPAR